MLILQCDVTTVNAGCMKLAKFIIEQFRSDFIAKKDQMEHDMPTKHACIILHIHRDQESTFTSFNLSIIILAASLTSTSLNSESFIVA